SWTQSAVHHLRRFPRRDQPDVADIRAVARPATGPCHADPGADLCLQPVDDGVDGARRLVRVPGISPSCGASLGCSPWWAAVWLLAVHAGPIARASARRSCLHLPADADRIRRGRAAADAIALALG